MVRDGRLTDTKLVSGRRYYGRADVERARQRLEYGRCMSEAEVSALTDLSCPAIWNLVGLQPANLSTTHRNWRLCAKGQHGCDPRSGPRPRR